MSQYLNYPVQILMELIWQLRESEVRSEFHTRRGGRLVSVFVIVKVQNPYHMHNSLHPQHAWNAYQLGFTIRNSMPKSKGGILKSAQDVYN